MKRLRLLRNLYRNPGTVAPAIVPFPLLHSGGAGGQWDELIVVGLIVLFFIALGAFGYYYGMAKKKRRESERRKSRGGT